VTIVRQGSVSVVALKKRLTMSRGRKAGDPWDLTLRREDRFLSRSTLCSRLRMRCVVCYIGSIISGKLAIKERKMVSED